MPARERRGQEKRVNRGKAGLSKGDGGRDTQRRTGEAGRRPLCLSGGHLLDRSLCDCLG